MFHGPPLSIFKLSFFKMQKSKRFPKPIPINRTLNEVLFGSFPIGCGFPFLLNSLWMQAQLLRSSLPVSASSLMASSVSAPQFISGWRVGPVARSRSFSSLNLGRAQNIRIKCDYACFEARDVGYRPPGTQLNLLNGVNFSLKEKSFGLIFGRSGSGKTTLLQILAGLSKPTSGLICIQQYDSNGKPIESPQPLQPEKVGIVFQFPERYFVADSVLEEVTFGWPRQRSDLRLKELLTLRLQQAINWVGLDGVALDKDPHSLSGGYKRRLALAIQLVQVPDLLILDEPLAGLDWKARADVVKLLKNLKKHLTVLVVSHDLKELAALVDHSWRMEMGGVLREEPLPV